MFNISEKSTTIIGLDKTGCTLGHIKACIYDCNRHSDIHYSYFGKFVSKGEMIIHTIKGDFKLKFDEKNAWARSIEITEIKE